MDSDQVNTQTKRVVESHTSHQLLSQTRPIYTHTIEGRRHAARTQAQSSSSLLQFLQLKRLVGEDREEWRGKKSRVACCLLMFLMLLLGHQQQVAGLSKFCRCYRNCYTECRKTTDRCPCNFNCFQDCINGMLPPASMMTVPADCLDICIMGFCGSMEIADAMAGDTEACVADCTKKLGAFAPSAAKINN